MKKILLLSSIFSLLISSIQAQDARFPVRSCATMEEDSMLRAKYPEMGTLNDFEIWMAQKIKEGKNLGSVNRVKTIYTIPVIVHVIHTGQAIGTGFNISDAQINSQIDVLNKDFRKLNSDTSSIPSIFKPVAADCEINFCMAKVDENGIPLATPGIDRINATSKGWSMLNLTNTYITNTIKPATIWNTDKFMNVWVVPDYKSASLTSILIGYATFPASTTLPGLSAPFGTAFTDGFVCWYKAFGNVGILDPSYNKGRAATHEIGHWLGLRHVWGDGAGCQTDYCNDTPISSTANFGCKTHPWNVGTCAGNTTGEMYMNYMDYTDDDCKFLFTNDQKIRVQTTMANSPMRIALATSTACNYIPTAGADAAAALITSPVTTSCSNSFVPSFTLVNYGNTPLTSCSINYVLDGGIVSTYAWTGNISSPGSTLVQLPVISGSPNFSGGAHLFKIFTSDPNGLADANSLNDTSQITFNIGYPATTIISGSSPYSQAFSINPFTASGYPDYSFSNPNTGSTSWTYTNTASGFGISNSCVRVVNFSSATTNPNAGQVDDFTTSAFDFTLSNSYYLNFNVAYAKLSTTLRDSLLVYASTDCDATWSLVYGKTQTNLATNGGANVTTNFIPTANQWRTESVDVSAFQGKSYVKFRFRNKNGGGNNIYVDDINISNSSIVYVSSLNQNKNTFTLYPNPSHGIFTLSTNFYQQTDMKISVIDLLGNVVFVTKKLATNEGEINFDLSNLAKGVYFVEVKTNKETITNRISIIE